MPELMAGDNHYDAIIVGAGPAGLTAGIYLSRARQRTLIVNEGTKDLKTGKRYSFRTDGTFIFIGYVPNTGFLRGGIELNKNSEIIVGSDMSTNIEGVSAAGDSTGKRFRQVTTAVGDGTIAALSASEYLQKHKTRQNNLIKI